MTNYLEDPDGAPYPETVQHFVREYVFLDGIGRIALVDALEAAIAADREHRPPPPGLDQEQLDRLTNIYAAGMGGGACTALLQFGITHHQAQTIGLMIAQRMLEDPATRLELEAMTTRMWTGDRSQPITWQAFTAYPSPRNHRDD